MSFQTSVRFKWLSSLVSHCFILLKPEKQPGTITCRCLFLLRKCGRFLIMRLIIGQIFSGRYSINLKLFLWLSKAHFCLFAPKCSLQFILITSFWSAVESEREDQLIHKFWWQICLAGKPTLSSQPHRHAFRCVSIARRKLC